MSDNGNEHWVLGVTLGLLGSIAINTGNNIQSLGLKSLQEERVEPEPAATIVRRRTASSLPSLPAWLSPRPDKGPLPRRSSSLPWLSPHKTAPSNDAEASANEGSEDEFVVVKMGKPSKGSIIWLIGTIIFVTGSLLNFASYAYAAQSMLASLESVQFVTNLLFGKFLLGAHVTQTMVAGTILTVTGTVMAVQFSSKVTLDLNIDDMKKLYSNPAYICYLILMGVAIPVLHFAYRKLDSLSKSNNPVNHSDVIIPCIYAVSSALFGTQSVVQAKVLAELLAVQGSGDENVFASWFTYMTLVIWILTVIVWLKRLNDALKLFNPLFIIPLLQCGFIFFAVVSGGIFFKEFEQFTLSQWLGFWFGIIVMFSGLVLLTPKPKEDDDLHRALMNLLLESRNSISNMSYERTPRSPKPTPLNSTLVRDDGSAAEEGADSRNRSPRLSKDIADIALDAVREVFSGDPSARTISEAMLLNTINVDEKRKRRNSLERLLKLIKGENWFIVVFILFIF